MRTESSLPKDQPSSGRLRGASLALITLFTLLSAVLVATPASACGGACPSSYTINNGGIVIGLEYAHSNFGGAWLKVQKPAQCTSYIGDVDYEHPGSLPAGWPDDISSYDFVGNCATKHYENIGFGGASIGYITGSIYIGDAMNDRTSSLRWS